MRKGGAERREVFRMGLERGASEHERRQRKIEKWREQEKREKSECPWEDAPCARSLQNPPEIEALSH